MKDRIIRIVQIVMELSKVKITIAVSFTTITGYVLYSGKFDSGIIPVTLGIFLLACGSSVINHIQEARSDAIMERTTHRPIPAGHIKIPAALLIASIEILAGSLVLFFLVGYLVFILGWIALLWYNLVYTYLKRITPHAVIPGSLIGAIPPMVGWVAAGGELSDQRVWAMAMFFFVWQVPHFYMLVMKYGPQYEKAGMPALTSRHSKPVVRMMIFLWIITTSLSALLLSYFNVIRSSTVIICTLLASVWLMVVFFIPVFNPKKDFKPFTYFMRINYYVLFIILMLNLDHVFYKSGF
jgi:protoheme IX farnesyltransferase